MSALSEDPLSSHIDRSTLIRVLWRRYLHRILHQEGRPNEYYSVRDSRLWQYQ